MSSEYPMHLFGYRSEEHTSELQSLRHLVCRLLLEKKKKIIIVIGNDLLHGILATDLLHFALPIWADSLALSSGAALPHRVARATRVFFFNDPATTEIYPLSLHDALPISFSFCCVMSWKMPRMATGWPFSTRSEEHTSELQSLRHLVCRLLLEKKNTTTYAHLGRPFGGEEASSAAIRLRESLSFTRSSRLGVEVRACSPPGRFFFFFNDTATTEIYTLSLHDALPISINRYSVDGWKHEIYAAGTRNPIGDRKSTRLNSSHLGISYAVFCLKKKKI